ncbi:response regulator [Caulobacter sp. 17J80-11]|nr:response regulator [Caulobacter sp. 17J80-11]
MVRPRTVSEPAFRILVVEDETLVALLLEELLVTLGCEVVGPVPTLDEGLERAGAGGFDAALLDVNLGGQRSHPIAELLAARGKPFAYATGYGSYGVRDEDLERPLLLKPFTRKELAKVVDELKALCAGA